MLRATDYVLSEKCLAGYCMKYRFDAIIPMRPKYPSTILIWVNPETGEYENDASWTAPPTRALGKIPKDLLEDLMEHYIRHRKERADV